MQIAGDSRSKHHPKRGVRAPAGGLVVSALFFFPRGGSAQVTRALARALPAAGWQLALAAGSLGQWGEPTHAASFFAGVDVHPLDYSPALERTDPLTAPVPFPPFFEDRPDAPDPVFAAVDDAACERLVDAWIEVLARAGADAADLLHLHHLTPAKRGRRARLPLGARAWRVARHRARDAAQDRGGSAAGLALCPGLGPAAARVGAALRPVGRAARGGGGGGAAARPGAGEAARPPERRRARALLTATTRARGSACVLAALAGRAAARLGSERPAGEHRLRRRGACPLPGGRSCLPLRRSLHGGQASPAPAQRPRARGGAARQARTARARRRTPRRVGGRASARHRAEDRQPAGLPRRLASARAAAASAERGRRARPALRRRGVRARPRRGDGLRPPGIACRTHGPAAIVADGRTGWLIPPDDEDALVDSLLAAANGEEERRARGRRAQRDSRRYGWAVIAPRFASLYEELLASSPSRQVTRGRRA